MREQETETTKYAGPSVKQMVWILSILLLVAVLIWSYNLYRLNTVTIEGLSRYTEEEFMGRLDDGFLTSMTPFFCLSDSINQKEIPFIEKYEIDYVGPREARIVVHEKRVTGCVVIMGRYMFFDKDGMVVESSAERLPGIPVVTGLEFQEIVLYRELQVQKQSLFDTILNLTRLIEQNGLAIQEIYFDSAYEVTLYAEDITVLLGKKESYDEALNALAGILEVMGGRTGTLDMRSYSRENGEVILKEP